MREIKFRYFDTKRQEFINDCDVYFIDSNCILAGDLDNPPVVDITNNVVVSQYTGLKDKNGKGIYEGDVLDLSLGEDSVLRCEVIYEAPSFCRKWYNANTIRLRQREIEPMAWNTHIVYEVIGNIYENPELLEESK
ncbi:YopX family protein [Bacillus thuringiensis]|uniref:YopX family protein n=1 Tax=Bacillus thuringiensis TaxID=1428 RepID=UPI003B984D39